MRSRLLTACATVLAAAALAHAPAAAATAHDYLVDSDPRAGATVTTAIDQVSLTFNDHVYGGPSSLVTVTGPDAQTRHFETGCATTTDRVVTARVALGTAGRYTVTYQIVSADGHTVSDSLTFTYQPPAGASPAPGTTAAACGATSASAAPTATPGAAGSAPGVSATVTAGSPAPTQAASSTNTGLVIGIAIAIVVLAVIGVVIVVLTSRRRPSASASASASASDETKDATDGPAD